MNIDSVESRKLSVDIAVQCDNFQIRLCWMLSSCLPATNPNALGNIPEGLDLGFDIAYIKGKGNPTVPEVYEVFKDKIRINLTEYPDHEEFQYRGWVRNRQLEQTKADWIIFADSDMCYPENFFTELYRLLQTDKYKENPHCLYSARFSTTLEETEALLNQYQYPCIIDKPWDKISILPGELKSNIGAGYFQMANVKLLRERPDNYYCPPGQKIDQPWIKYAKAKSDQHFRRRLGRESIPLPVQRHLQHVRDHEAQLHLDVQR
jgi:hypothetical protein